MPAAKLPLAVQDTPPSADHVITGPDAPAGGVHVPFVMAASFTGAVVLMVIAFPIFAGGDQRVPENVG